MMLTLHGMTWDHPRGYDPLVACAQQWKAQTQVDIVWHRRSLQDFESYPVQELARRFDLIVIDHPHVGQITQEHCLAPLDEPQRQVDLNAIARDAVGASLQSYQWDGRIWALPIDAATQVQAWIPGRLEQPLRDWDDMIALAEQGAVACPLRPPHSLMVLYTLSAHLGGLTRVTGPELFSGDAPHEAYERLRELAALVPADNFGMDPIAVFEEAALPQSRVACVPLIYGYVNYAIEGFRAQRIAFADMPVIAGRAPRGSALGGTGIAVSAMREHAVHAADFAYWVAGESTQRTLYTAAGGQAGHGRAWEDPAVNAATADFYRATRATLDGAWVRPRHNGYMAFQHAASLRLNQALAAGETSASLLHDLNRLFRDSLTVSA